MGNDTPLTDAAQKQGNDAPTIGGNLKYMTHHARRMERDRAELIAALEPFAALRQPHQDLRRPEYPIFGINGADITLADLDRARSVLSRVRA